MWRTLRAIALVASVGVAGLALSMLPGSLAQGSSGDVFDIDGTGMISPGLPAQGAQCCQQVWFNFNAAGVGTDTGVYTNCYFQGNSDVAESLQTGHGSGTIYSSASCNMSGNVTYARNQSLVQVTGVVTVNAVTESITGDLVFVPTSSNPTTSFMLTGEVTFGDVILPNPTVPPTPTVGPLPTVLPSPSTSPCNTVNTAGVCVNVTPGAVVRTVSIAPPQSASGTEHVVGTIDMYSIPSPFGGTLTFPCVVLSVDATSIGGCAALGATWTSTFRTLVDTYVVGGVPAETVNVCAATITVTVDGFGANNAGGDTLC